MQNFNLSYKLRIECLLLKEEFNSQMIYFNKSFDSIFKAADIIYNNFNLAKMMIHICKTGNFINEVIIYNLFLFNMIV